MVVRTFIQGRCALLVPLCVVLVCCALSLGSCAKDPAGEPDDPGEMVPNTCLADNGITISGIENIPAGVTFNKVVADISGADWQVIGSVEGVYTGGRVTLELPPELPAEKLQKGVRDNAWDYTGFWRADTDNPDAMVARLGDIIAYDHSGERIGRVYLTDWTGEGTIVGKSYIYYHYASQPFALSGTYGSYRYEASFAGGWNAYANMNRSEGTGTGAILCTAPVSEDTPLGWRFEPWAD